MMATVSEAWQDGAVTQERATTAARERSSASGVYARQRREQRRETLRRHYTGRNQVAKGVVLTAAIISSWLALSVFGLLGFQWGVHSPVTAPLLVAVLCWLYVGLFIVAHDCMHGSLVPGRPRWNRCIGSLCLLLYAGFDYDALRGKHALHHRHAGTADDPDFDERAPHAALKWYGRFFTTYFSLWQVAWMALLSGVYLFALDVHLANLLVFWAVPAILSSVQLFYFGTFQPHRPDTQPFADRHRAHRSRYGWWRSLLTCFHFGHHHAHHLHPHVPWWGLPALGAAERNTAGTSQACVNGNGLPAAVVLK